MKVEDYEIPEGFFCAKDLMWVNLEDPTNFKEDPKTLKGLRSPRSCIKNLPRKVEFYA